MSDSIIESLRAALAESPDNAPLRLSLAKLLFQELKYEDAEAEYRAGLKHAPHDASLKIGLAEVFYAQGKFSAALVVCEELDSKQQASAQVLLIMARAHFQNEQHRDAGAAYRRAKQLNPDVFDDRLDHFARERAIAGDLPEEAETSDLAAEEQPRIKFADVGGMEELKEEIRLKIIHPLTHPEIYAAYGKKIGGGILLYGPPGCGKTHLARATAGEVDARFLNVGVSDVLDMYIGQSERNLRAIFEQARERTPCVLFFDEVDALAASRRDMRQSAGRQVINQFLSELDGMQADNEGVLIMAATNAPWHLDGAFRRPGRFDRILFVPPPDEHARVEILKVLLQGKPAADVDLLKVARKTKEFSGADLKAVIDLAIEDKLKVAMKSGIPEPLSSKDLLKAAKQVRLSTKEWFQTARNHALYANEGGLYDEILKYMGIKK